MLVPLVSHHGSDALDSPLSVNLQTYELYLAQNLGAGVQACWRGPRLYDTGLKETARIRAQEGASAEYPLDRQYNVELPIDVPAKSVT